MLPRLDIELRTADACVGHQRVVRRSDGSARVGSVMWVGRAAGRRVVSAHIVLFDQHGEQVFAWRMDGAQWLAATRAGAVFWTELLRDPLAYPELLFEARRRCEAVGALGAAALHAHHAK